MYGMACATWVRYGRDLWGCIAGRSERTVGIHSKSARKLQQQNRERQNVSAHSRGRVYGAQHTLQYGQGCYAMYVIKTYTQSCLMYLI